MAYIPFKVPAAARKALDEAIIADIEKSYREFAKQRKTMGRLAREPKNSLTIIAYEMESKLCTLCYEHSEEGEWHDVRFATEAERAKYIKSRVAALYRQGRIARSLGLNYNGQERYLYEPVNLP